MNTDESRDVTMEEAAAVAGGGEEKETPQEVSKQDVQESLSL